MVQNDSPFQCPVPKQMCESFFRDLGMRNLGTSLLILPPLSTENISFDPFKSWNKETTLSGERFEKWYICGKKPPCRHNIYHYITFEEQSLEQSVFAITNMYFLCRFLCYQCMTLFLKALIEPQEKCYNLNEKISTLLARSK